MPPSLLAEFDDPGASVEACRFLRARGWRVDLHAPFALPEAASALGIGRSRVPLMTLMGGLGGALAGYLVQWWCTSVDYPLRVGGMPRHPAVAFIPITFESLVLGACGMAFVAMLIGSGLPRLWHPLFEVDGFERASIDRFFLELSGGEGDAASLRPELARYGVLRVIELEDPA